MSHSSENSYREQDQFEEIEHIVTIEKKVPETNSKYLISNSSGNNLILELIKCNLCFSYNIQIFILFLSKILFKNKKMVF